MSCPFHCGRVEGQDGKRSRISSSESSSDSSSSDDTTTVFVFDFRPANNERSELENDRVCDLVWECEGVHGLEWRLEDDEELPERRWAGNDRVLMKRWVKAGREFD